MEKTKQIFRPTQYKAFKTAECCPAQFHLTFTTRKDEQIFVKVQMILLGNLLLGKWLA